MLELSKQLEKHLIDSFLKLDYEKDDLEEEFSKMDSKKSNLLCEYIVAKEDSKMSKEVLLLTIQKILDHEAAISYQSIQKLIVEKINQVFNEIQSNYQEGLVVDSLSIKAQILNSVKEQNSELCQRYDRENKFIKFLGRLVMESLAIAEGFKTLWMEFFCKGDYYDYIDNNIHKREIFYMHVMNQAKKLLEKYPVLEKVIYYQFAKPIWKKLHNFSKFVYKEILEYSKEIRTSTKEKLLFLDHSMRNSKFLTSHVVISCVYRLKYELMEYNKNNFGEKPFLFNIKEELLSFFWRESVIHFDKEFETGETRNYVIFSL